MLIHFLKFTEMWMIMNETAMDEIKYIVDVLTKAPKEKRNRVLWSAMHILKINPDMSIKEAMDYGYKEWV